MRTIPVNPAVLALVGALVFVGGILVGWANFAPKAQQVAPDTGTIEIAKPGPNVTCLLTRGHDDIACFPEKPGIFGDLACREWKAPEGPKLIRIEPTPKIVCWRTHEHAKVSCLPRWTVPVCEE